MSACDAKVFQNITQARFDCLVAKAKAANFHIEGTSGTVSKSGAKVTYNYDPAAKQLTIQCIDKPWIVSCDFVYAQLVPFINGCISANPGG
jgi:hypothetical protein